MEYILEKYQINNLDLFQNEPNGLLISLSLSKLDSFKYDDENKNSMKIKKKKYFILKEFLKKMPNLIL